MPIWRTGMHTITASGAQALKQALPNAELLLPKEVAG